MRPVTTFRIPLLTGVSTIALLTISMATPDSAMAEVTQLPGITVYATTPQLPDSRYADEDAAVEALPSGGVEDPESPLRPPSFGDGGEFLRHVNGVEAGRMGGHGLDPVIRGLDQNQLSITNDGAFHFGGCPNRMDPPTSHMQLYTYDKAVVKRGYNSVLDGPPAPGGSVAFERVNPTFAPDTDVSINIKTGGGYNSNGNQVEGFVDMSMGNDWGYIRGFGSFADADNYKDGDGNEVRSSFTQFGGGGIIGRTFDADSWITLKIENNNVDDVLFPGSGMDAPVTDDWTYQLKGETDLDLGIIRGVKADVYLTTVDHVMNNFDLRDNMMHMEARMEADTLGGKIVLNGASGEVSFDVGADFREVMRDGKRYSAMMASDPNYNDPQTLQAVLWGDTSIKELGLFAEAVIPLAETTKMTAGLRFAHVRASTGDADETPTATMTNSTTGMVMQAGRSPNTLYQAVYGVTASDQKENNIGGLVRLEQQLADGLSLFGTLSRSVRTADATERYIASYSGKGQWVGNPNIAPEKHHQVDLGVTYNNESINFKGSAFYNSVDDFIQRYVGQDTGTAPYTNVTIHRNIDATLMGFEAEAQIHLSDVFRINLSGAYTHGENETSDVPLAQIPPLSGRAELIYDDSQLMAGVRVNAAAKQTRIDWGSDGSDGALGTNLDARKTPGWMSVDLFGSYNLTETFQLNAGVTNVFDETYANHLNREDGFNAAVQVNEPGRSFYVRGVVSF